MPTVTAARVKDAFEGVLLGTAIGDALGLPFEGMTTKAVARAFREPLRFTFVGRTGIVSDDTEQTALVAQSLAAHPADRNACVAAFRWSLLGWFLRLPWGIGFGTLRACMRIALGLQRSGVGSAGNGAAMRAAVIGAFFFDDAAARRESSDAIAKVTHTDERGVEGARFVAEVAAMCLEKGTETAPAEIASAACAVVGSAPLREAIARAIALASGEETVAAAASVLGNTGFVLHTVSLATFCFVRSGARPGEALAAAVRAGGDTDSNAAIVGAWMGALHGASGLPAPLVASLHDGPFGLSHLRALASDLAAARTSGASTLATYRWPVAMIRNVALFPIVLAHAFRVVAANVIAG